MFSAQEISDVLKKIEKLEKIVQARGASPAEESVARSKIVEIKIKYGLDEIYKQKSQQQVYRNIEDVLKKQEQFYDTDEVVNFNEQVVVVPTMNEGRMTWWVNGHEFFTSLAAHTYAQQRMQKIR